MRAERTTKDRELQDTSTELSRANEACQRLKVKLGERKQAAATLAAALGSELGLPPDVQAALAAQDNAQLPAIISKLSGLVIPAHPLGQISANAWISMNTANAWVSISIAMLCLRHTSSGSSALLEPLPA